MIRVYDLHLTGVSKWRWQVLSLFGDAAGPTMEQRFVNQHTNTHPSGSQTIFIDTNSCRAYTHCPSCLWAACRAEPPSSHGPQHRQQASQFPHYSRKLSLEFVFCIKGPRHNCLGRVLDLISHNLDHEVFRHVQDEAQNLWAVARVDPVYPILIGTFGVSLPNTADWAIPTL